MAVKAADLSIFYLFIFFVCLVVIFCFNVSMDGFRVVRIEESIKTIDILITCTGRAVAILYTC